MKISWGFLWVFTIIGCATFLTPGNATTGDAGAFFDEGRERDIAMRFSPIIVQDRVSTYDEFTSFDFDGDWNPLNNWGNMDAYPREPVIYYQLIESETHYFVYYFLFYPRNEYDFLFLHNYHENDVEGMLVVARKDRSNAISIIEFQYHGNVYIHSNDTSLQSGGGHTLYPFRVISTDGIQHPVVLAETGGHGLQAPVPLAYTANQQLFYNCSDNPATQIGFSGSTAPYSLVPVYGSFWSHRDEITSYDADTETWIYASAAQLPIYIPGDDYGPVKASFPWSWVFSDDDNAQRGDWFFNPIATLTNQGSLLGVHSIRYVYNPYFSEMGIWLDFQLTALFPLFITAVVGVVFVLIHALFIKWQKLRSSKNR